MWKNIASNAFTLLALLTFLLAGAIMWGKSRYNNPGPSEAQICLQVTPGTSFKKISNQLEEQEIISNGQIFRLGADYTDKTSKLKAGSWLIPPKASMNEITDIITRGGASTCGTEVIYRVGVSKSVVDVREMSEETGKYEEVLEFNLDDTPPEEFAKVMEEPDTRLRVAVAEGTTSWQITDALNRIAGLEGEVEVPAEGTLAPNSYEFKKGDERQAILERMKEAQATILADAWAARAGDLPIKTPEEALILASIIEKETGVPEERGTVAGVFTNRLRQRMKLQTDPTVIYGITNGEGILGRGLKQSELRTPTPYNTYVIPALPPTPIANPGKASIEAAVNPDKVEYLFFVADGTGGHAFAKTVEEHNANVVKWRKIEAERKANQ